MRERRRRKNLNKKIDCFINHIFLCVTLSKLTLKEAKENILTIRTKMKTAQEEGTLSPEETKDMSIEILDLVEEVAEIASAVAEGVPAENGGNDNGIITNDNETTSSNTDNSGTKDGTQNGLSERINQGKEEDKDEEKLELKEKVAKLTTQVSTMQKEAKQEKLAVEYAKHFPITQREAKQKEFAKSSDSLPILEARLKEAKSFFKNPSVIKEAALRDNTFEITEMPGNNSNSNALDFGGKF